MKKIICTLLILILCAANQLPTYAAESITLPSGIASSDIESIIDSYVKENEDTTAAMSVAVLTGDKILLEKAYGYTDLENKLVNDRESVFEWGSCTKLLTWVSVMQLVEKGSIDLNKDIQEYLPDGFLHKLKFDKPITMLNLMNHNAGWQETATDLFVKDKKNIKELGDALQYIEPAQANEPGKIVTYSNWGAALAGYIVECVSGQNFGDYVHANIFKPLGMDHTAIKSDLTDNEWVLNQRMKEKCYTTNNESLGTSFHYLTLYPSGMATGTLTDFIKFAQAFLPAEGNVSPLFTKVETLKQMLSPSLTYIDGETPRICHGLWTDQLGVPVLWHDGGTLGSSSWFAFDKESGTGIVTLTNQKEESIYNCGLLPIVFGKYDNSKADGTSSDISGIYVNTRSCFLGYTKLYSLFNTMEISKNNEGSYTVNSGVDTTITGISKDSYLMDMGGEKQFILFKTSDKKGANVLQMVGADYVQINGYGLLAKLGLLLLFVITSLYSFIILLLKALQLLRRKPSQPLDTYRMLVNISAITQLVLFFLIAAKLLMTETPLYQDVHWMLLVGTGLAALPISYAVILIIKWRGLNTSKKTKIGLIVNCIMGLIVSFNMLYWII